MIKGYTSKVPIGWEIFKLGDLCEVITKGTTPTSLGFKFTDKGINFIKVESLTESGKIIPAKVAYINEICHNALKRSQLKENDILFSIAGALGRIGIVKQDILPANTNQALAIIRLKEEVKVSVKFLANFFNSSFITDEIEKLRIGAAQQNLSLTQLKSLLIPLPPLPEQYRIVSLLDSAFEAIDQAKSNAEKNLVNAKEMFESYLQGVFSSSDISIANNHWEEQPLENCFRLKSGDNLTSKNMSQNGSYPVYGGNGIAGYHTKYNLSGSNVIIGRVGALCGNVRHIKEEIWLTDNAFKIVDLKYEFDDSFLTYLLNFQNLRSYARQAAQPVISNSSLRNVILKFPKSLKEQKTIVSKFDTLQAETQQLETLYQKKIAALDELKKSILQKAFRGELETE